MPARSKESDATTPPAKAAPLYLVWGGDEFLVSRHAKELVTKLCPPDQQSLGLEVIDGAVDTVDEAARAVDACREALTTVGFFASEKTVWLRDASFLSDAMPGKSDEVKSRLAKLVDDLKSGLQGSSTLVLSTTKIDRRSALYKLFQSTGTIKEFAIPEKSWQADQHAEATVLSLLREQKLEAGPGVIESLLARAGADTRQIAMEIEKLALYLGDRKAVRVEDIDAIVSPAREAVGWDLAEAIASRRLAQTLRVLRRLLYQKEQPVGLLALIESRMRDLLAVRALMDRGWLRLSGAGRNEQPVWDESEAAREAIAALVPSLKSGHPYRTVVLCREAQGFPPGELRRWHDHLLKLHERMTSGLAPPELLLELGLIEMMKGGRRAA